MLESTLGSITIMYTLDKNEKLTHAIKFVTEQENISKQLIQEKYQNVFLIKTSKINYILGLLKNKNLNNLL